MMNSTSVSGTLDRPRDSETGPSGFLSKVQPAHFATLMLLVALWLVARPYIGIVHDARLYSVQALYKLSPAAFQNDLYFRYGSQDSFSIFSVLYAPLIASAGVPLAHFIAFCVGEGLWLSAIIWLSRTLFPSGRIWLLACVSAMLLHSGYGGLGIFHYAEPFASPRLFAEAAVLAAFAAAASRRYLVAISLLAVAATFHPIMSATGFVVIAVLAVARDRRVLIAVGAAVAVGSVLALLRVGPFGRLWLQFDPEWLRVIKERCGFGFITRWDPTDFWAIGAAVAVLSVGALFASRQERRITLVVVAAGLVSLVVTFVGADLAANILITNAQPWRQMWLVAVAANVWTGLLCLRVPAGWVAKELFIATAAFSAGTRFLPVFTAVVSLLSIAACLALIIEWRLRRPMPKWGRYAFLSVPALAVWFIGYLFFTHADATQVWIDLLRLGLAIAFLVALYFLPAMARRSLVPIEILCLVASLLVWDQRGNFQKMLDGREDLAGMRSFVSTNKNVFWDGDGEEILWFGLRMPSYYSCLQGAGAMFYRGTAIDYEGKEQILRDLRSRSFSQDPNSICPGLTDFQKWGPDSRDQLASACRRLPDLDFIVLNRQVPGVLATHWKAPEQLEFHDGTVLSDASNFYGYECSTLR